MKSATEATYRVLIKGVRPATDANLVRENIAKLFKISHEAARRVLEAESHIAKGGLTADRAAQYRTAIEGAGANCVVEIETWADLDLQPMRSNGTAIALDIGTQTMLTEHADVAQHDPHIRATSQSKLVETLQVGLPNASPTAGNLKADDPVVIKQSSKPGCCWSCKGSLQYGAAYCHGCGAFQRTITSQSVESLTLQMAQSNPLAVVDTQALVAADHPLGTQESILLAKFRLSEKLAENQFASAANAEFDKSLIPMLRAGTISERFIDLWLDYWRNVDVLHAACTDFLFDVTRNLGSPLSQDKSSNSFTKSLIEAGLLVVPMLNPVKKRGMIFDPIAMSPRFGRFVDRICDRLDSAANRIQTGESDVRQLLAWRISTEIDSSRLNEVLFRLKILRRYYSARALSNYDPGVLVGLKDLGGNFSISALLWASNLTTTELANAGHTLIAFDEDKQDEYFHTDKKTSETIGERFDEIDASIDSLINDTDSGFQIIGDPNAWLESKLIGVPCLSADEINVLVETDLSELSELVKKSRVTFDARMRIILEAILKELTDRKQEEIALRDAVKLGKEHAQQAKTFAAELVKQQQRARQMSEGKFNTAAITDIFGVVAGASIEGLTRREK